MGAENPGRNGTSTSRSHGECRLPRWRTTAPATAFGSSITLDFGKTLPDLTVPELKKILSGVLDFERHSPTVLYSPNVPPASQGSHQEPQRHRGNGPRRSAFRKGSPDRRVREVRDGSEQEDWIYGIPPHVLFVTFDGDQVVSVKQY